MYDILNEFQKGHSHMAAVVRYNREKTESLSQGRQQSNRHPRTLRNSKSIRDTTSSRCKRFFVASV